MLAHVNSINFNHDTHHVNDMFGGSRVIAGRMGVMMEIELVGGTADEQKWLLDSLRENGMSVNIEPNGSPIVRPEPAPTFTPPATSLRSDKPKQAEEAW